MSGRQWRRRLHAELAGKHWSRRNDVRQAARPLSVLFLPEGPACLPPNFGFHICLNLTTLPTAHMA